MCTTYTKLNAVRRGRFDLYVLSTFNSVVLTVWSVKVALVQDPRDASGTWGVIMVVCGYLVHDFWATRKEWLQYPDQLLHHIAGIGITSVLVLAQPSGATRYTGHYMLLESSTIFLNTMWMMKECGLDSGFLYRLFSYIFLALFTVTRIFYMTYLTAYITVYEPEIWS